MYQRQKQKHQEVILTVSGVGEHFLKRTRKAADHQTARALGEAEGIEQMSSSKLPQQNEGLSVWWHCRPI